MPRRKKYDSMRRTTIYLPDWTRESLKNAGIRNLSDFTRGAIQDYIKNKKMYASVLLCIFLAFSLSIQPCAAVTTFNNTTIYQAGDTYIIPQPDFIPFELWLLMFLIAAVALVAGFIFRSWFYELLAVLFGFVSAFATPAVGFYDTHVIANNATEWGFSIVPSVQNVLQPWVVWLCYGIAILGFVMFVIILIADVLMWMDSNKEKDEYDDYANMFLREQ